MGWVNWVVIGASAAGLVDAFVHRRKWTTLRLIGSVMFSVGMIPVVFSGFFALPAATYVGLSGILIVALAGLLSAIDAVLQRTTNN